MRYVLMAQAWISDGDPSPIVDASIQAWDDNNLLETVRILDVCRVGIVMEMHHVTIEQQSTWLTRVLKAAIDDAAAEAYRSGTFHGIRELYERHGIPDPLQGSQEG